MSTAAITVPAVPVPTFPLARPRVRASVLAAAVSGVLLAGTGVGAHRLLQAPPVADPVTPFGAMHAVHVPRGRPIGVDLGTRRRYAIQRLACASPKGAVVTAQCFTTVG